MMDLPYGVDSTLSKEQHAEADRKVEQTINDGHEPPVRKKMKTSPQFLIRPIVRINLMMAADRFNQPDKSPPENMIWWEMFDAAHALYKEDRAQKTTTQVGVTF